ncbi:MAG: glycosyltransferase family 9 protein [Candidatus Abyssobacteria bacterium SURF_5]|jgi:lipopolysaccharide heptosyltransferase I|uniref:Glycosyltransferase family 9 protein n=1 Tax=Abyssobacteria bacterium (strain SURF_5) TaxID=2093360 RepID=A0A3A4P2G9_ABYX5|nr:MAG: glycosyltransferase family 9 protein [Candidatus Abyssubacteria bacterium SURF_5]
MKTHKPKLSPKRILIIRLSSIGDVARTLPALTSLRREFPHAHIAWAVEDKSSGLLEGHPHLDEVITFERIKIERLLKSPLAFPRALFELGKFVSRIYNRDFDLVFDFHGILKSGLIAACSRAPVRVGFSRSFVKEFSYLFTNRKVSPSDFFLPRVDRNLQLIKPFINGNNPADKPLLGLTTRHCEKARAFANEKFKNHHALVAVHPGTSRLLKHWFPRRFAEVCDMLAESLHANVLLTWGPGERELVEEIRALTRSAPEIAPQTQSLLELAALLQMCSLMITVDCGPMHIASLLGVPVVALFGPTDTRINGPYWHPYHIITGNISCRPCDENCESAKCMEAIAPGEVFRAAVDLLAKTADAAECPEGGKLAYPSP